MDANEFTVYMYMNIDNILPDNPLARFPLLLLCSYHGALNNSTNAYNTVNKHTKNTSNGVIFVIIKCKII